MLCVCVGDVMDVCFTRNNFIKKIQQKNNNITL